jgi:hypothetical protein
MRFCDDFASPKKPKRSRMDPADVGQDRGSHAQYPNRDLIIGWVADRGGSISDVRSAQGARNVLYIPEEPCSRAAA